MYFITYNIIKKRSISLLAALLIALHPKVNIVSIDFQRDVFYLFFFGLFLLCIIKSVNWGRIEYFIGTGLVMSLCIISRAESLELIIIAAVSSVLVAIKKQTFFKAIVMFLLINIVSIICIYLIESSCGMKNYTLDYYKAEMLGNLEHESI
jgi:4-amino-4-deoxy-L-arabinose transferase-like glycosyltransferase